MSKKLLLGSDPEIFLVDKDGVPQPAIGLIGGTKDFPEAIGNDCYIQEDNVMAEFNVPPSDNPEDLHKSINYVIDHIASKVQPLGLFTKIVPSLEFRKDQLLHPQAQAFGCEPDFNAWTEEMNQSPKSETTIRSAGGHLHLGFGEESSKFKVDMIRALDLFITVPSLHLDKDVRRRELYGKAGAFRVKRYGVELRTLSNFWITNKEYIDWVYQQANLAYEFVKNKSVIEKEISDLIIESINTNDLIKADLIINNFNLKTCVEYQHHQVDSNTI